MFLLLITTSTIVGQHNGSLPGSKDFACWVFNQDAIPLPSAGIGGALRNPANYGIGIEVNKYYLGRDVENFLGVSDIYYEKSSHDIMNIGFSINLEGFGYEPKGFQIFGRGFKVVFGAQTYSFSKTQLLKKDEPGEGTDWIYGVGDMFRITDDLLLRWGFVKTLGHRYFDDEPIVIKSNFAAEISYQDNIVFNATYRKVNYYDVYKLDYSKSLYCSYLLQNMFLINGHWELKYGVFGKLYSNPNNLSEYVPVFFARILPHSFFKFIHQDVVYFELMLSGNGSHMVGATFGAFNIHYAKNKSGGSWEVVYLLALLIGGSID